ncbi:hypothetical protein GCM10007874_32000 [Labrys miyagiensis]|uniref:DUF982 domain-containing protein n=1 Tax=Labrys miyagiensis TaxID=346912 RepID=A0ABQ6CKC9_9HYPH|nr:hypothetical protein GCM10007874_32000 [Labrys miyagiensis]
MFRSMQKLPFERPVYFTRQGSLVERVSSVDEAAYYLLHRWPNPSGTAHEAARRKCREVLAKTCGEGAAREAFIVAVAEAGMTIVER